MTIKHTLRFILVLAMFLVPTLASAQPADDDGGEFLELPREKAQKLYSESLPLQAAGQHQQARALLQKALKFHRRPDIAAALGETELALKNYVEAMQHLNYAIGLMPDDTASTVHKNIALTRKHVATLRFRVLDDQAALAITIDGNPLASHEGDVFVLAGEHEVRAKLAGHHPFALKTKFRAAVTQQVDVVLTPLDIAPPGDGLNGYAIGAISSGVATAILLGVGTGLVFAGLSQRDDAEAAEQACQTTDMCSAVEAYTDADSLYNAAGGVLVMGGVSLATMVVFTVLSLTESSEQTSAIVLPVLSPNFAGLQFIAPF